MNMNNKKVILSITDALWDLGKGKGFPARYNFQKFISKGFENHVFLLSKKCKKKKVKKVEGTKIHYFPNPEIQWKTSIPVLHFFLREFNYLLYTFFFLRKLIPEIEKIKPDLIYGHGRSAFLASLIARKFRVPNITRNYGAGHNYENLKSILGRIIRLDIYFTFKADCKKIIITNDGTRGKDLALMLGVPEKRICFWRNGINDTTKNKFDEGALKEKLGIKENDKVIVSLSRITKLKKIDLLIKSAKKILKEVPNLKIIIVGEGSLKQDLVNYVRENELEEFVKFPGAVNQSEINKYIRIADVIYALWAINPVYEGLIEGKCVLTLEIGDTHNLIDNYKNGVLIESQDLKSVDNVLIKLLRDDKLRGEIERHARDYAIQNFENWDERFEREKQLILDVIKKWKLKKY
jgi:glycosyltransferase involved in cell wall biosynthesis